MDSSVNPIVSGNIPTTYNPINTIIFDDTMVNHPDETNV